MEHTTISYESDEIYADIVYNSGQASSCSYADIIEMAVWRKWICGPFSQSDRSWGPLPSQNPEQRVLPPNGAALFVIIGMVSLWLKLAVASYPYPPAAKPAPVRPSHRSASVQVIFSLHRDRKVPEWLRLQRPRSIKPRHCRRAKGAGDIFQTAACRSCGDDTPCACPAG